MEKREFREKIERLYKEFQKLFDITFSYEIKDVRPVVIRNINGKIEEIIYDLDKICEFLNEKPMPKEVEEYFIEKYEQEDFRIVPGHHPSFQTTKQVDEWLEFMRSLGEFAKDNKLE